MTFAVNQSGAVYGATVGVSRNMQTNIDPAVLPPGPPNQGGGNLNGTAATSILIAQSGTDATRWQMPRKFSNPGNWCGII
jgi:hypothetical protein